MPVTFTLNGKSLQAEDGQTILQAARAHGVEIPTLCYDPRLPPYGSCLVCVVEVRSAGRLLMSCTTPVSDGMDVWTESVAAKHARKTALEMLLSNHYADCRGPCFLQCPANVDVQGYLAFAHAGMHKEALDLIRETNPLPLSCGRICVRYCEANCRRKDVDSPAAINFMKRYVADLGYDRLERPEPTPLNGKRVAVIGGGPAGLTCAYYLRQKGVAVTIYDMQPKLGGMLRYGIPEYRLPQDVLDKEVGQLLSVGIDARTGVKLGLDITLDGLKAEGHDAIFLAMGSWVAKGMGIEGEDHPNILPGIVFLEAVKREGPPSLKGTVAIVGGGNTAVDAARTALRCGADKVAILYRRTRSEMPADDVEVEDAVEEGVDLQFLLAPKRAVVEDGRLLGLECTRMELGAPDASGRRRPMEVAGSEFLFEADWLVSAIGQEQDLSGLANATLGDIRLTKWRSIDADPETFQTSVPGVFAGGDVMTGPAAAIDAIAAGRKAALVIDRFLETGTVEKFHAAFSSRKTALSPLDPAFFEQFEHQARSTMPKLDDHARRDTWMEVDTGVDARAVAHETGRCLSCGCSSVFDCDLQVLSTNYDANQEQYKGRVKKHKVDDRHPNIILDANKCILCGRCVRYCGELIGVHALGFQNRGFETLVKPTLDRALQDTTCIACGNCIEVCPTGAITFKASLEKPGPFRTTAYRSICSFCGVGCELDVNHCGRDYFFITAKPEDPFTEGELCERGRFGTKILGNPKRLYTCMEKGQSLSMEAATERLRQSIKGRGEDLLILASGAISTETAQSLSDLAVRMGTPHLYMGQDWTSGRLTPLLPAEARMADLDRADALVLTDARIVEAYPVLGFRLRRAVQNGLPLVIVGPANRALARLAMHLVPDLDALDLPLLQTAQRALLLTDAGHPKAQAAAQRLGARLLMAEPEANGRGVREVFATSGATQSHLEQARTKRFGAVLAVDAAEGLPLADFTTVFSLLPTAATEAANLVVPLTPLQEQDGTLSAFDGRTIAFKRAFKPLAGFDHRTILEAAML